MGKICKGMAFSCLQKDGLRQLTACIVTDTEVAGRGCCDVDFGIGFDGRHTSAQWVGEEIASLIISVTDCPTLFDESGQCCQSQAVKRVEVRQVGYASVVNVLALSVIR